MGLIAGQDHLTVVDAEFEAKRERTWPGMAHWAGSGPKLKTCRECTLWSILDGGDSYFARAGKHRGALKPRSCAKYRTMMQNAVGPTVPYIARACKYFDNNSNPPPIIAPR